MRRGFNTNPEFNHRIWTCATQETKVFDVDPEDAELVGAPCVYGETDLVQTSLCLTFDPKGDAITGTKSGDIQFFRGTKLWKIERGRHRGPVNCVHAESRPRDVGGPVLFTAGKDGVIQEWAMKLETLQYVNEVEWKIGRRFVPGAAPGASEGPWCIRSLMPYCKDGILGFGTREGAMHEFRFGDTNGGDGKDRAGEETPEDILEETLVTMLQPLYDKRPNLEPYPCASKAEGGIAIAIHPTSYTLITADYNTLRLWHMPTRELIRTVEITGGGMVCSIEYAPSGKELAVGLDNGLVMVYSTETWDTAQTAESDAEAQAVLDSWVVEPGCVRKDRTGRITCVKYSPTGALLAAGSSEGIIDVYDAAHQLHCINSCQPSKKMGAGRYSQGHGTPIVHIDWDVEGHRLRTVCESMEQLYWEVGSFRGGSGQSVNAPGVADVEWDTWTYPLGWHTTGVIGQVEAVSDIIASARANTGGKGWIAVGEHRGGITIFPFPCRDGEEYEVAELTHSTARLTDVILSHDDEFMVTSSVDGVFQWRVVDADAEEEEQERLAAAAANRLAAANEGWESEEGSDGGRDAEEEEEEDEIPGAPPAASFDKTATFESAASMGIDTCVQCLPLMRFLALHDVPALLASSSQPILVQLVPKESQRAAWRQLPSPSWKRLAARVRTSTTRVESCSRAGGCWTNTWWAAGLREGGQGCRALARLEVWAAAWRRQRWPSRTRGAASPRRTTTNDTGRHQWRISVLKLVPQIACRGAAERAAA